MPAGIQRLTARLGDIPIAVFAADWTLVWWNTTWSALHGDPTALPPAERSLARALFGNGPAHASIPPVRSERGQDAFEASIDDGRGFTRPVGGPLSTMARVPQVVAHRHGEPAVIGGSCLFRLFANQAAIAPSVCLTGLAYTGLPGRCRQLMKRYPRNLFGAESRPQRRLEPITNSRRSWSGPAELVL
ncbi:hypothetical protein ACIBBB_32490 [Streptomyces sp. NPDC051217]|uniref:MmyB family transcriptional regulator n=1 Tax=Streptomyces sp. NPDC051217 TaxID=3365644 RepID=UPI0037A2C890